MDRNVNDALKFNQETEFIPILGMMESQLNASRASDSDCEEPRRVPSGEASSIQDKHHPALLSLLSEELSISPEEIHDFELYAFRCCYLGLFCLITTSHRSLYDTQPSVLGGVNNEFIFSPRMDNLFSSCVQSPFS